jgi:hypothetical protein
MAADLEGLGAVREPSTSVIVPNTKVSSLAPPASAVVSGFLLDTGPGLEY